MASRIAPIIESAAALPEARSHSPWRRSACDRCRSQKLRCTRKKEDDTTTPCTRCLRIRFPCFTSPAKPPGRLAHRRNQITEPSLCTEPPRHAAIGGIPGHSMPVTLSSANPIYVSWPFYQPESRPSPLDEGILNVGWPGDYHSLNSYQYALDSSALMFDATHSFPAPTIHSTDLSVSPAPMSAVAGYSAPGAGMEMLVFDNKTMSVSASKTHQYANEETHTSGHDSVLDPGVLLSGLQQTLSKQLYALRASPPTLSVLNSSSPQLTEDKYGFNPLSSALGSTAELLSIAQVFAAPDSYSGSPPPAANGSDYDPAPLMADDGSSMQGSQWPSPISSTTIPYLPSGHQGLTSQHSGASSAASSPISTAAPLDPALFPPRAGGGAQPPPSSSSSSLGQPVLSNTYLLTLVSCHVQLLSVYDAILSRISVEVSASSLQHHPHHPAAQFNSSYAVNFQRARSIAQMVDQRLDEVERALGLPREYCVSSRTTTSNGHHGGFPRQGLLAGREARAVLGILLGGSPSQGCGGGAVAASGSVFGCGGFPPQDPTATTSGGLMFEDSGEVVLTDRQHVVGFQNNGGGMAAATGHGGEDVVISLRERIHEFLRGGGQRA